MLGTPSKVAFSATHHKTAFRVVIKPLDFVSLNTIYVDRAFEVDWGNGTFISYGPGNAVAVASGTITARSVNNVTRVVFESDTFIDIDIQESNTLTDATEMCWGLTNLKTFAISDASNLTSVYSAWGLCVALTSFPLIDTSSVESLTAAWYGCSGLTSFPPIDTSSAGFYDFLS